MPFIDLDIPATSKKKNVETLTRIEEKQVIKYILNGEKQKYSDYFHLFFILNFKFAAHLA